MRKLSQIVGLLLLPVSLWAQSPHGSGFEINCDICHTTESWDLIEHTVFDHDSTSFSLEGQHKEVSCRQCHVSLNFSQAENTCISCHSDIHSSTLGQDCDQCHTSKTWIVTNIREIHLATGFPLLGSHGSADCYECHSSASLLRFEPKGTDCNDCHNQDYLSTQTPPHASSGFSTACFDCHNMTGTDWSSDGFEHGFFPLTQGHNLDDCTMCHTEENYKNTPSECNECHSEDYNTSSNPAHISGDFSRACDECHTTHADWKPATFRLHDAAYFPIYSGKHNGEWDACSDCHSDPGDYSSFSCIECHHHRKSSTDNKHKGVSGYYYDGQSCLACHPDGSEHGTFDHNKTNFPLTGLHQEVECLRCHVAGYAGTSTACKDCHQDDYISTKKPSHVAAGFDMQCEACHTSQGWEPAKYTEHDAMHFPIYSGKHNGEWNDCVECHTATGNYSKFDCTACHEHNKQEADEDHVGISGYSYTSDACYSCHPIGQSEGAFDHNSTNFPLTGEHRNAECIRCHASGYEGTSMLCNSCHSPDYVTSVDPPHQSLGFPTSCDDCHTTSAGWVPATFAIHNTFHPLNGAHANIATECNVCHKNGYLNTPNSCDGCHSADFNETTNPSHIEANFARECDACHTESAWAPSTFNHDEHYALRGTHALVASDCMLCHTDGYANTPNTCVGCHTTDYNNTSDPAHAAAQFPKDCEICHTESSWSPSTFNHDAQYFPIYSGKHREEWQSCNDCHSNVSNFAIFVCTDCHEHNKTSVDKDHKEVNGYIYNSVNCLSCHPQGRN